MADKSHRYYLSSTLWQYQLDHIYTDVTLVCEDGQLEAHCLLLAKLLARLGVQGGETPQCIVLQGLKVYEVQEALNKIYLDHDPSVLWEILNMYQEHDAKLIQEIQEQSDTRQPGENVEVKMEMESEYDHDQDLDDPLPASRMLDRKDFTSEIKYNMKTPYVGLKNCGTKHLMKSEIEVAIKIEESGEMDDIQESGEIPESDKTPPISRPSAPSYSCDYCEFSTDCKDRLRNHEMYLHKSKQAYIRVVERERSKLENEDQGELAQLLSSIEVTERGKHKRPIKHCHLCDFKTGRLYLMGRHLREKHGTGRNLKFRFCSLCDFKSYGNKKLRLHMFSEHGVSSFDCDKCDYKTHNPERLEYHNKITHEGLRVYCDQCDWKGTTNCMLKKHISSVHMGIKHFCDQCEYQSNTIGGLKNHKKAKHENIKFICDQCNLEFNRKTNLDVHVKIKHEGMRYNCDKCSYQATTKRTLRFHLQANHGQLQGQVEHLEYALQPSLNDFQ